LPALPRRHDTLPAVVIATIVRISARAQSPRPIRSLQLRKARGCRRHRFGVGGICARRSIQRIVIQAALATAALLACFGETDLASLAAQEPIASPQPAAPSAKSETEPTLPPVTVRPPEAEAPAETASRGAASAPQAYRPAANPFVPSPANEGRAYNLLGQSSSASEGYFGQPDIVNRAILRPGEVLQLVPGMVVTQHSGSGKANQYFLRGYNLDHGTDFFATIDDVPMNLRTHGHGQGYLDLNSLIPELVETVHYRKGPYYAEVGDFGSVGSADIRYSNSLPQSYVKLGGGMYDFWRMLLVDSSDVGQGSLLTVFEYQSYDGPWGVPEGGNKYNGVLKYTIGDDEFGAAFSALAYANSWTSTDQIPERAVTSGLIGRLDTIDPTDGGKTTRATANAQFWKQTDVSTTKANFFFTYYDLDLFSNFTFFLDDEVNGDQFQQADRRRIYGINLSHSYEALWAVNTVGAQFRSDDIPEVGLFHTAQRTEIGTFNDNRVNETSYSLYASQELTLLDGVRPMYGLRGDLFHFDVNALDPTSNAGVKTAGILSPKAGVTFGPWAQSELYLNWGMSFHSNDARGVVATVDPATPLVRTQGEEIGFRSRAFPGLTSTVALWNLDQDSELLFVGDAGTNEPSRPSRRTGVEWTNFYQLQDWLTWDADVAFTHARFTDSDPAGNYIPGAIGCVVTSGPTVRLTERWTWGLRFRYFGPRPLIEDNSVRSNYTSLFNMHLGYNGPRVRAALDFLNLFNSRDQDITYFYDSRLPGEPTGGVADRHFHPLEPFGVRLNVAWVY
jgi:hypothetical protein